MINTKKIGLNEFYKNYSDNPNIIQEFKISKEQFKRVIKSFSKKELDKILLDSEEVKLPILGTLRIKKIRKNLERQLYKNRLRIDWKETRKTGCKLYHLNEHRNGYFYRFHWDKNNILNKSLYSFYPERWNAKRRLCKILKTTDIDYFE